SPIDTIVVTAAMPMMMPSVVSPARTLFFRSARAAMRMVSRKFMATSKVFRHSVAVSWFGKYPATPWRSFLFRSATQWRDTFSILRLDPRDELLPFLERAGDHFGILAVVEADEDLHGPQEVALDDPDVPAVALAAQLGLLVGRAGRLV